MDVQATGDAFSPQKKTSSFKKWHFLTFLYFCGHFCPPGSGSGFAIRIQGPHWIRIQSGPGSTALIHTLKNVKSKTRIQIQKLDWIQIHPDPDSKRDFCGNTLLVLLSELTPTQFYLLQHCPHCRAPIEKNEGCNKITCRYIFILFVENKYCV
jgi:hypothetical protein